VIMHRVDSLQYHDVADHHADTTTTLYQKHGDTREILL